MEAAWAQPPPVAVIGEVVIRACTGEEVATWAQPPPVAVIGEEVVIRA